MNDSAISKKKIYFVNAMKLWLIFVVAITLVCGLIYLAVQQNYRMSANDPQIQMAQDSASTLSSGVSPEAIIGSNKIEIYQSLAPYIIIYNENGEAVASSGVLDGAVPNLPSGVLAHAKSAGESRITWQPRVGIRQAVVVEYYHGSNSGFAVSGRSLKEAETRIDNLTFIIGAGWVFSVIATLIAVMVLEFLAGLILKK